MKELRNSNYSEVKLGGKNWDDNEKPFNKNYLSKTTWNEGQSGASAKLVWPSPQNQVNLEEKFNESPLDERRNYQSGKPGHLQYNCTEIKPQNVENNGQIKKVYCLGTVEASEGKIDSQTLEANQGCPSSEISQEVTKMADQSILKTLNIPSCTEEQREASTLTDGTTLTTEHPEKSMTDKDQKYGDGLQSIEHVKSAFALTLSPGGQESPSAAEIVTVSYGSLERDVSVVTQLKSVAVADLMLLKTSNENSLAQEQQEINLIDCFETD